jgi:hypothetical protein
LPILCVVDSSEALASIQIYNFSFGFVLKTEQNPLTLDKFCTSAALVRIWPFNLMRVQIWIWASQYFFFSTNIPVSFYLKTMEIYFKKIIRFKNFKGVQYRPYTVTRFLGSYDHKRTTVLFRIYSVRGHNATNRKKGKWRILELEILYKLVKRHVTTTYFYCCFFFKLQYSTGTYSSELTDPESVIEIPYESRFGSVCSFCTFIGRKCHLKNLKTFSATYFSKIHMKRTF